MVILDLDVICVDICSLSQYDDNLSEQVKYFVQLVKIIYV